MSQNLSASLYPESHSTSLRNIIKVSDKNKSILERIKPEDPRMSINPGAFDRLVEKALEKSRRQTTESHTPSLLLPIPKKISLALNSCFMWYILRGKSRRSVIPDYELTYCRSVLQKMIKSMPKGELHFGYAKLCFHDEQTQDAFYNITESLKHSSDMLYKQWFSYIALQDYCNNHEEALNMLKRLEAYAKESPSIENLWALMTLSLKDLLTARIEIELPHYYATQIKRIDSYYGYLAYAEIFMKENNVAKAKKVLSELIEHNPTRPEAYALMWEVLYKINPDLEAAEDLMTRSFVRVTDSEYDSYIVIFSINLAKIYSRLRKFNFAFELLQEKFVSHPQFSVYLYHYGRLCVKANDSLFTSSGIGALVECLRLCDGKRHGKIYYWLARAYFLKEWIIELHEAINLALERLSSISDSSKANWLRDTLKTVKFQIGRADNAQKYFAKGELARALSESENSDFQKIKAVKATCLWLQNQREAALSFLNNSIKDKQDVFALQFLLAKYLKKTKNFSALNSLTKKLIKQSKNTQVVTSDWVSSHIWYARCKSSMHKPDKALPLLQCLAKIFPPLPQYEVHYTKYLISAKSPEDFLSAASRASRCRIYETYDISAIVTTTFEGSFDETSPEKTLSRREFTSQCIEDSVDDGSFDVSNVPALEPEKYILSHKSIDITLSRISDRGLLTLGQGLIPTGNRVFIGFSVSSQIWFLYYIGKICMDHDCNFNDGLCAVQDFLTLTDLEREPGTREKARVKGTFVKSFLLISSGRVEGGKSLFLSIKSDMEKLGLSKKLDYAQKCLSYI